MWVTQRFWFSNHSKADNIRWNMYKLLKRRCWDQWLGRGGEGIGSDHCGSQLWFHVCCIHTSSVRRRLQILFKKLIRWRTTNIFNRINTAGKSESNWMNHCWGGNGIFWMPTHPLFYAFGSLESPIILQILAKISFSLNPRVRFCSFYLLIGTE